jgi:Zn-dependent peptidase ImmA (M78 family)/DNA-binding XRE family transcriptional regulator
MSRAVEVPITPSVLRWAIEESGYSSEELAQALGVGLRQLETWTSGESKPTLTHARKLADKLHRPFASLLLPEPPESRPLPVQFRHPLDDDRQLSPNERRYIRRAARFQEVLSWLMRELEVARPQTPLASVNDNPVTVARVARELLGVSASDQERWDTPSMAFDEWREALEETGHFVFLFSLGKESSRGFSLWDEFAPVVAVNSAWNESARIFTLFHELGHLMTRTSSACVESVRTASRSDPVERWCEAFAAAVLMPSGNVESSLARLGWHRGSQITTLPLARSLANVFKVSLRAAVIRLIELNLASWSLYDEIPPISDRKPPRGGGTGRSRSEIREDQLGSRVTSLLVSAVDSDVLSRSQAVDFLDIPDTTFDGLAQSGRRAE